MTKTALARKSSILFMALVFVLAWAIFTFGWLPK